MTLLYSLAGLLGFFWIGLAVALGIDANTRGRSGTGWFLFALLFSPVLVGFILLALPSRARPFVNGAGQFPKFEAEGIKAGIPYRRQEDGRVEALMPGGIAVFQSMDQFSAASMGRAEELPSRVGGTVGCIQQSSDSVNGFRYRVEPNGEVLALLPNGHEMKFRNWNEFWAAAHGEAQPVA